MSKLALIRTDLPKPSDNEMEVIRRFLFGCIDGFTKEDKKRWRRFWSWLMRKEAGELTMLEIVFPRLKEVHRKQLKLQRDIFDSQERFTNFDQFWYWIKIGAGWVDWAAGVKGGVVPIPKSVSYAEADEMEFEKYCEQTIEFFRGEHCAPYLWKHLGANGSHQMMEQILEGFRV